MNWNWGDGTTTGPTTSKTASHTYASSGTYTIVLTVTDNLGATNTKSQSVTVGANQPPVASFTVTGSGLTVSVDASASYDPDGSIATYAWNWGDGKTTGPTTAKTASHTYASSGTYTIVLTVTDNLGATGTKSKSVTVSTTSHTLVVSDNTPVSPTYPAEGTYSFPTGAVVGLTADYMFEYGGYRYTFRYWLVDGVSQGRGVTDVDVVMDADHTASAVYTKSIYL